MFAPCHISQLHKVIRHASSDNMPMNKRLELVGRSFAWDQQCKMNWVHSLASNVNQWGERKRNEMEAETDRDKESEKESMS